MSVAQRVFAIACRCRHMSLSAMSFRHADAFAAFD